MSNGSEWKGSRRSIRKQVSKRDRLQQIHKWLINEYGRKTRLRVEKLPKSEKDCLGYVELGSGIPLIRVSKFLSRSESISVLLHEYCHVISHYKHGPHWKRTNGGHDDNFYLLLCAVENRYFYEGGTTESQDF